MKRNELKDGMVVAIKRERTDYPTSIYKGIVRNPEENGGYRNGGKLSVKIEIPNDREDTPNGTMWVQLWQIIGDYDTAHAALELRKAEREIARLKREIRDREIYDTIKRLTPHYEALGIRSYNIRKEFKGSEITIAMTPEQFESVARHLQQYPRLEEQNQNLRNRIDELQTERENA